ncbi:unnamed protein product, partial [marine sediment metagenome]
MSDVYYLVLHENYAFVANHRADGITVIDISVPSIPTIIGWVTHANIDYSS